jgi:D-alanyl-D-alanine carboxypeptidase/D-alanyl-D-alanine-endopeptidase (penicillin-binding protein 4)
MKCFPFYTSGLWLLIGLMYIPFHAWGQPETIQQELNKWQQDPALRNASWSFTMIDTRSGNLVAHYDKDRSLPPASGIKAITTLAALQLLGPDYRWQTVLQYDGVLLGDSVITGNVYIQGGGDPTLGSSRIQGSLRFDSLVQYWSEQLYASGIRQINGEIVADASWFDNYPTPGSWNWDDIGQYYGAGTYGLNCYENMYTLYYSSGKTTARIDSIFPNIPQLQVSDEVRVYGTGDNAYIYGAPESYNRRVTGSIPANKKAYEVDGSMPNPPAFLANELTRALENKGIRILNKPAILIDAATRSNLFTHSSPILDSVLRHTNEKSINLYAETLLKTIGKEINGEGSYSSGVQAVVALFDSAGIDQTGLNLEDGSGLSRLNIITTYQMAALLRYASTQPHFAVYKSSLPVSGKTGTLKSMCKGTIAEGKVMAKSGSMQKIRSYSGYVQGKDGGLYAFSIIVNNYTCGSTEIRSKLEKMMVAMAGCQ